MRFVLCQISNKLINPDAGSMGTTADRFYESLYESKRSRGYIRPEHFWELPLWIGEASYTMGDVQLEVITDTGIKFVPDDNTTYCFSVLDVNKGLVTDIINNNPDCHFLCGGYITSGDFLSGLKADTVWADSIADACAHYGVVYKYGADWKLFKGEECIPRLTLSYGCSHSCKFCTVPNKITTVDTEDIISQAMALVPLKFKLVYLNDKTFGQADNWEALRYVKDIISSFNPDFEGFIVQTSVPVALKADLDKWVNIGVTIVELGIETVNNDLLRKYRKPQNVEMINTAVEKISNHGIDVIGNLILGLIGETSSTYQNTYNFIKNSNLFALNIYTLALYNNAEIAGEVVCVGENDSNELSTERSFWSAKEKKNYDRYSDIFYTIGAEIALKNFKTAA